VKRLIEIFQSNHDQSAIRPDERNLKVSSGLYTPRTGGKWEPQNRDQDGDGDHVKKVISAKDTLKKIKPKIGRVNKMVKRFTEQRS